MTPQETTRAIELLLESQQLMAKNMDSLYEFAQQQAEFTQRLADATAQNTHEIGVLTNRIDALAARIDDYLRGVRNGH